MTETRNRALSLVVNTAAPDQIVLTAPGNAATGVSTQVTYTWAADPAATNYLIEIATDNAFTNIVDTATVTDASYSSGLSLMPNTQYFWRVTASNLCGIGTTSATFSYTTANELCVMPNAPIPDDNAAGVDTMLNASSMGLIQNLRISLVSNHTYPGDLIATLSHNGTSVTLMDRPGFPASQFGCGQDGVDVEFDDASGTPVETMCNGTSPGIGGTVAPEQMLSAFNGAEVNGTWTLNVSDNQGV